MPTVEGTRVKCPECGATSHAQGEVIKCEYCGVESRVQKRTQVFQLPVRLPDPPAHHPMRVAVQVRTRVWPIVVLIVGVTLLPFAIIAAVYVHQRSSWLWNGDHPLIADIDGDGTSDAIGIARYVSGDRMKLRAISGKDGHTFWEGDSLGNYIDVYQNVLAVSGTTLMYGSTKHPRLEAFDLKTGKKAWSAVPPEAVEALCEGASATTVTLETKDKVMYTVDLASGKLAEVATAECTPLHSTWHGSYSEHPHRRAQVFGMSVDRAIGTEAPFVLSGTKSPGTPIPMVAAIDADEHVLWKSEIPADHARSGHKAFVAIQDQVIAAMYDHDKDTDAPTITTFDRATGKRLFTTNTKYSGHMFVSMHGIDFATGVIFATVENSIQGFDPKTGERRFVVGSTD